MQQIQSIMEYVYLINQARGLYLKNIGLGLDCVNHLQ